MPLKALITDFFCSLSLIPAACNLGPVSLRISASEDVVEYLTVYHFIPLAPIYD
jgi:hypothetical protein